MNASITGVGTYVPEQVITNAYFEKIVETSDEWIQSRTGIVERRYAGEQEFTSDLCYQAAKNLSEQYDKRLNDVDFIIVASITPDYPIPSLASQLQNRLGINNPGAIDITAACAGFIYGLILAKSLIISNTYKKILVFGGETLSKFTDFEDRTSCILFGDGAGCMLVEATDGEGNMFESVNGTDGSKGCELYLSNQSDIINNVKVIANNKIHQNGKAVFKWAIQTVAEKMQELLKKNNSNLTDIDWFIPHSANKRIIDSICDQLKFPKEKTLESIANFGNTSSASIPLALNQGIKQNKIKKGDNLVMFGFGGGLTYAGIIVKWDI